MKIFIVTDSDARYGCGNSVQDAFYDLKNNCGSTRLEELTFYEGTEIQVELQAVTHFKLKKGEKKL